MKKSVEVMLQVGVDATPIAQMVQIANSFDSRIYLEVGEKRVNVKSIMGMMSLALTNGTIVEIDASGTDEEAAISALEKFLTE